MNGTRFALEVRPSIPERLQRLPELANDLLYSWDSSVRSLFLRLDPELWESCGHNPKVFLRRVSQQKLELATEDPIYIQDYNRVLTSYDAYHSIWKEESLSKIRSLLNPKKDLVMKAFRYIPADLVFSPAITARPPVTSAFRSSPWACSIDTAIFTRPLTATATSSRTTSAPILKTCPSVRSSTPTAMKFMFMFHSSTGRSN